MKLIYYFKMLRVKDWIKLFFWVPIAGAVLVNASLIDIFYIAIISFALTSYSFVVNNYFDVEIDKKNEEKKRLNINPLTGEFVSKKETLILMGILLTTSLFLSFRMDFTGFLFIILTILSSTFYSIKYIRFKEKNIIDITNHGLMFGLFPFLAGLTLAGGTITNLFIMIALFFTLLSANALLAHQIIDYQNDIGITNTTAIKIGREKSYFVLLSFLIFSLFLFEFIVLRYYPDIRWWLFFPALSLLIFWWLPLKLVSELIKERERVKEVISYGLLLPNMIYKNSIKIYQEKIKDYF